MVAKKLLVEDKITAWVKQVCLLGKVSNRKTLFGETFCFLEKRSLSIFNCVLRVTYCFLTRGMLIGPQPMQLSRNVLSFSFNPIGQLCPGGPAYSSGTVSIISIRKQKRFISKLDQSQPHIHSKIMVLKKHNCKMVYSRDSNIIILTRSDRSRKNVDLVTRKTSPLNIIHSMSDPEGNSFVFPRVLMFRRGKHQDSRENKKTGFPRDLTLSVLLYF